MSNIIKTAYGNARRLVWSMGHRTKAIFNHDPRIVHQGIQRSGTNYLRVLLNRSGFFVLNEVDPKRHKPQHKHCRWQDDKESIVMDGRYRNKHFADSIEELNKICGYEKKQKHVLIFKTPYNWLESIQRWGIANHWFSDSDDFLGNPRLASAYLNEWDQYHLKWELLAGASPGMVLILHFESVLKDPENAIQRICEFYGVEKKIDLKNEGRVEKVRHSKKDFRNREKVIDKHFVNIVDKNIDFSWRNYIELQADNY